MEPRNTIRDIPHNPVKKIAGKIINSGKVLKLKKFISSLYKIAIFFFLVQITLHQPCYDLRYKAVTDGKYWRKKYSNVLNLLLSADFLYF